MEGRPPHTRDLREHSGKLQSALDVESSVSNGPRHHIHKGAESGFDLYRRNRRVTKLFRQSLKFGLPLRRNSDHRRKVVGSPPRKNLFGRRAYRRHVQLAQQVNQQDVEHIASTSLRIGSRAGV